MPNTIPFFDFSSRAQITRKTLERLACFSKMQSSSSESGPLLDRTLAKINGFVKLLDSSILTAEFGYEFATAAMIACDKGNTKKVGSTMEDLSSLASKASDVAQEVATGFKGIEQAVYKIAASTKDSTFAVHIPPDPTQTKTVHKNLRDVGTDLVANLKLFSQFSRIAEEIAEWWACVKKELMSETPSLPHISTSESSPGEIDEQFVLWTNMKENLWEYYTTVNVAQNQFPDLLGPSIAAWQSAASARNVSDPKDLEEGRSASKRDKSIGQLLSRFLEKRTRKVRSDTEGKEPGIDERGLMASRISENVQGKGASDTVPGEETPSKNGKIRTFFTTCISAGPICKCL